MLSERIEDRGSGLTVSFFDDPERTQLHPSRYAAAVRADALAGKIEDRWPGHGTEFVEKGLVDIVTIICGYDVLVANTRPCIAAIRAAMKRWARRQARLTTFGVAPAAPVAPAAA